VATTWYNFHIMLDERRLWTAVLAQAIHDLIGIDTGKPGLQALAASTHHPAVV
jgi:hypothetical protein